MNMIISNFGSERCTTLHVVFCWAFWYCSLPMPLRWLLVHRNLVFICKADRRKNMLALPAMCQRLTIASQHTKEQTASTHFNIANSKMHGKPVELMPEICAQTGLVQWNTLHCETIPFSTLNICMATEPLRWGEKEHNFESTHKHARATSREKGIKTIGLNGTSRKDESDFLFCFPLLPIPSTPSLCLALSLPVLFTCHLFAFPSSCTIFLCNELLPFALPFIRRIRAYLPRHKHNIA